MSYTNVINVGPPLLSSNDSMEAFHGLRTTIREHEKEINRLREALARAETRAENSEKVLRDLRGKL